MRPPVVIYEDSDLLVVDKPSGLQVHAAKVSGRRMRRARGVFVPVPPDTLTDWLVAHYPEVKTVGDDPAIRPGIVHRLDKETSGVMLVPRNQKYFEYLKSLFQKHEVQKTYLAVVAGKLKQARGVIDAPIGIQNGTLRRSVRAEKMAKPAVTEYKVLETFAPPAGGAGIADKTGTADGKQYSLLALYPKTGRTHQIRVHLASIGHPVVGDRLYGSKAKNTNPAWATRLMLHAFAIEFTDLKGKRMRFEADPPDDWTKLSTSAFPGNFRGMLQ